MCMCFDCMEADALPSPDRDYRFVQTEIAFTVLADDGEHEIVALVEWDETDPWAVAVNFPYYAWFVGRELLKAGLHDDVGLGDARFCGDVLHPNRRLMILDSPDGHVVLRFDPIEMSFFVDAVDRQVRLTTTSEEPK